MNDFWIGLKRVFLYGENQIIDIFTSITRFNQDCNVIKILKTYRIIQHELLM